jgi:hypothetical protein
MVDCHANNFALTAPQSEPNWRMNITPGWILSVTLINKHPRFGHNLVSIVRSALLGRA